LADVKASAVGPRAYACRLAPIACWTSPNEHLRL
jgi:hypothetical protein